MPKAKSTRSSLSRKEATLYLLRSEDSVTRKPMSVKLGFSTRPIQHRQDELSAAREKFTTRLALHTVTNAPVYEKLAKLLLREIMPERWYSSNGSLEFMHHRAGALALRTLRRVCALAPAALRAELREVEARHAAKCDLLRSPMASADARVVQVRTRRGRHPVKGSEALYFPRSKHIYHQEQFWTPREYCALRGYGTQDVDGRIWLSPTAAQPMRNLRGEAM